MPTQECSQLTWDIPQHQESHKKMRVLNENFLLTSCQNKNGYSNNEILSSNEKQESVEERPKP